jgi:hypothetical protein
MTDLVDAAPDLRKRISGRAIGSGDAGYDDARSVCNAAIDRHPALIARCAGVSDVQEAMCAVQVPGDEIKKETQMMFLDCPAYLDYEGAARCGLPAEVTCSYTMQSTDGPLDGVMIKCPSGHLFNGPLEFLTWKNGERQDARRPFDREPVSDVMEPASSHTIMADPEPGGSVAGLGQNRYAGGRY